MSRREQILSRMVAVLESIPGVALVERNLAGDLPPDARPALLLTDGDEATPDYGARRPGIPAILEMQPIVSIVVEAPQAEIGTTLNDWVARVQIALFNDDALAALLQPHGAIFQRALGTEFGPGRVAEGVATLALSASYVLRSNAP